MQAVPGHGGPAPALLPVTARAQVGASRNQSRNAVGLTEHETRGRPAFLPEPFLSPPAACEERWHSREAAKPGRGEPRAPGSPQAAASPPARLRRRSPNGRRSRPFPPSGALRGRPGASQPRTSEPGASEPGGGSVTQLGPQEAGPAPPFRGAGKEEALPSAAAAALPSAAASPPSLPPRHTHTHTQRARGAPKNGRAARVAPLLLLLFFLLLSPPGPASSPLWARELWQDRWPRLF